MVKICMNNFLMLCGPIEPTSEHLQVPLLSPSCIKMNSLSLLNSKSHPFLSSQMVSFLMKIDKKSRLAQLESLDEKRFNALEHLRSYHSHIQRAYSNKIIPKEFKIGDLILKEKLAKPKRLKMKRKENLILARLFLTLSLQIIEKVHINYQQSKEKKNAILLMSCI